MNRHNLCILFFLLAGQLVCSRNQPDLYNGVDSQKMKCWVDSLFNSLSSDEKIGQLFMLTTSPASAYRAGVLKNINEQKIGGLLFSKGSVEDLAESANLFQKSSRIPLLISFDGEWGLSMRLENTPRFPKNMMLGAVTDNELLTLYGAEMGRECRELGVHINFAPVLDVNNNPDNPVIGTRSFGENPQSVSGKAIAYAKGLESQRVMAVGKHFPGHGDTSDDSHKTLPVINHNKAHLDEVELYPFTQFIKAGFAGIMTGHLSVPALDNQSGLPTSLSPKIVTGLLKTELGFTGLAFTDALAMKGATGTKNSVCVNALLAGNDVLLNPTQFATEFTEVKKALASGILKQSLIDEKCRKILQYKYIAGLNRYKPVDTKNLSFRINSDSAAWLVQKLNNEAITLLKNQDNKIPLKQLGEKKIAILAIGSESGREFHKKLSLYGKFDFFSMNPANAQEIAETFRQLKNYDVVICEIYSVKERDFPVLQSLTREKEVHFCFFTPPYILGRYKQSISNANSVILAYEDTDAAQKAAAEIIMGGIPAKGKLPVTISGLFEPGTGLETQKVRLSYQNPVEEKMSGSVLDKIELIVQEGLENKAFPGCQVLVAKEGVVVYNKSFGFFDYNHNHPVQNSDVYDLASVTKATATLPAIMKLYDTKKIALTDKISRFVPELEDTDKENISIRDALYHETGLIPSISFYQLLINKDSYSGRLTSSRRDQTYRVQIDADVYARTDFEFYPELVSKTPKSSIEKQVAENFYISNDFNKVVLDEIAGSTLKKSAGYLYSDLNFMLLKEVVENISNQSIDLFLQSQFYAGLGANYTDYLPLRKIKKEYIAPTEHDKLWRNQVITGYPHDEAAAVMGGISGNAGLFSNANDLAKLLQMFLYEGKYGGEKFLSRETVQTFTQTKSKKSRRGLGFDKPDMINQSKSPAGDFATASTYGHTGYTGTCFWVDPDNQLIYVFLSNRVYPSRTHSQLSQLKIRRRIQNVIYEAMNPVSAFIFQQVLKK